MQTRQWKRAGSILALAGTVACILTLAACAAGPVKGGPKNRIYSVAA